jgi:hypothetical protein
MNNTLRWGRVSHGWVYGAGWSGTIAKAALERRLIVFSRHP